jgi:hypothetical protein
MAHLTPLFAGRVQDGKIQLADPVAWRALLQRNEGREIDLRLTRKRKVRSMSQNAYYWSCVVAMLAEYCGYEPEEMHTALKFKFLQKHEYEGLPTVQSTTDLGTVEFTEYVESCRRLAAELGVNIPDPGAVE